MIQETTTPNKINIVTEHKENYKLVSLYLMDCYNGLHPPLLCKLSHVIFNLIIYNKLYRNTNHKHYDAEEDKRIYSNILITPENILKRLAPSKYQIDNKDIENDIANLSNRLQILDDNNIFYIWRYKQPFTYVFIMERDVGCWKYYNSEAFLTPKTLKKIVRSGKCIIDTMIKLESKRQREIDKSDIEKSFGNFLNRMIDKMNPSVISNLSRWVDTANIFEYIVRLNADLRAISDYEGQVISDDFMGHLPDPVRKEISNRNTKETKMNASLELQLVPQNENLTKIRKTRSHNPNVMDAKVEHFQSVDPFKNATQFVKFYRSIIREQNNEAKFFDMISEANDATYILDAMIKHNRNGDKKFLRMWIYHFYSTYLKGNNVYKTEKTSVKELFKTLDAFDASYYG